MDKNNYTYNDFAFILTWPDATIRGDEKWMMFFKKIGFVKNLNFKVGHTGIVLVNHLSGELLFYDFGRYITPRGYGRARSKDSDPRLEIAVKAKIDDNAISNVEEIVAHFEDLKGAMYGEGQLFFSIATNLNFAIAKSYCDGWVVRGTYPYGAVAKNNNNCSRFITRTLMYASKKYHHLHGINFPETFKASPISNVVNAVDNRMIYSYSPEQGLKYFRMSRWQSFGFLLKQVSDNVIQRKSDLLPNDLIIGAMNFSSKPENITGNATYLGGVGDGAWYVWKLVKNSLIEISRYTSSGQLEYTVLGKPAQHLDFDLPFEITYDSNLLFTHVMQNDKKIKINHLEQATDIQNPQKEFAEMYA
ncbi:DUF6695 family protein [Sphingobacterium hungaricum]|uniref:Uncharacterized protein n=1 Tax=Sphingobacterium hungaricum TaxID=2082723 RepID=A0A928YS91_9SPHI|nr:DUF6695 family protein [Sphingobacterium hungaricum]MBE8714028.1 hypothetical protein [Sphingobacterium hungaricum]